MCIHSRHSFYHVRLGSCNLLIVGLLPGPPVFKVGLCAKPIFLCYDASAFRLSLLLWQGAAQSARTGKCSAFSRTAWLARRQRSTSHVPRVPEVPQANLPDRIEAVLNAAQVFASSHALSSEMLDSTSIAWHTWQGVHTKFTARYRYSVLTAYMCCRGNFIQQRTMLQL